MKACNDFCMCPVSDTKACLHTCAHLTHQREREWETDRPSQRIRKTEWKRSLPSTPNWPRWMFPVSPVWWQSCSSGSAGRSWCGLGCVGFLMGECGRTWGTVHGLTRPVNWLHMQAEIHQVWYNKSKHNLFRKMGSASLITTRLPAMSYLKSFLKGDKTTSTLWSNEYFITIIIFLIQMIVTHLNLWRKKFVCNDRWA